MHRRQHGVAIHRAPPPAREATRRPYASTYAAIGARTRLSTYVNPSVCLEAVLNLSVPRGRWRGCVLSACSVEAPYAYSQRPQQQPALRQHLVELGEPDWTADAVRGPRAMDRACVPSVQRQGATRVFAATSMPTYYRTSGHTCSPWSYPPPPAPPSPPTRASPPPQPRHMWRL